MSQRTAGCGGWALWIALGLSGCVLDSPVGRVPSADSAVDPDAGESAVQMLHAQLQGLWCGSVTLEGFVVQTIEIRFDQDTYTTWCTASCPFGSPFPGEPEASEGRYAITQVTLNGQGWGWSEHQDDDGQTVRMDLEHILILEGGSRLQLERSSAFLRIPLTLAFELTRCEP